MTAYGLYRIRGGDAGTSDTLHHMAALVEGDALDRGVREVAAALALGTGRDSTLQARLIRDWVDTHTEFLPDPVHAEALTPPARLVTVIRSRGIAQCDCDDVAMLAAALGMSIGLRARLVVVAFGTGHADPFAHVWSDLAGPTTDDWLTVDPTRPVMGMPPVSRTWVMELGMPYTLGDTVDCSDIDTAISNADCGGASSDGSSGIDWTQVITTGEGIVGQAINPGQPIATQYPTYLPTSSAYASPAASSLSSLLPLLLIGGVAAAVAMRGR